MTTQKFAQGVCYHKLAYCFVLGSLIGTVYEEIITFFKYGEFQTRRGVLYGPFNPLYGVAFIVVIILFHKYKNPVKLFIVGGLFGMLFELVAGLIQLLLLGSRSWDYSGQFLNIYGYTSPFYGVVWGLLIIIIIKLIYPFTSRLVEWIPNKIGIIVSNTMIVLLTINLTLTISALSRQSLRHKGVAPYTPYGEFLDKTYTDEVLLKHFPDMEYE